VDRLGDGGWMVDGSGGCRVDSRSPKIENEEKIKGKYSKKGDLQGQRR